MAQLRIKIRFETFDTLYKRCHVLDPLRRNLLNLREISAGEKKAPTFLGWKLWYRGHTPLPFREGLGVGCSFFLDADFGDGAALAADVDAGGEVAVDALALQVEVLNGSILSLNHQPFHAGNFVVSAG